MKRPFSAFSYRCSVCAAEYGPDEVIYACPADGANLDVVLDYADLRSQWQKRHITSRTETSLWRYLPLLPVSDPEGEGTPLRAAGFTPLFSPSDLASRLGLSHLWIKDESRNPTASFKDRASAIVVVRAIEVGAEVVVTASTGNAGAALAGMAAAMGRRAVILAPRSAPPAKIAQLLIYGAQVFLVDGNYDQAFDLSVLAADEFGWYCRNTGYNPFTAEGKKTAAFEIWEALLVDPAVERPLTIVIPVGDGNIISGIHKGFKDLAELGWLDRIPRLIGVQAEGSAAIARAYEAQTENIEPVQAETLADSIAVDLPRDGLRALRAASQTGGAYVMVSDAEILTAMAELGRVGIFAEPAGSAAYAGLVRAARDGLIGPEDPVVVLNTGNGLKDVGAARRAVGEPAVIEPTLSALKGAVYG